MNKINKVFVIALQNAMLQECDSISPDEHIFTKEFEDKMGALIKRRKKPYYKLINSTRKRVACFILILLLCLSATALAFDSVRSAVANFFVSIFDTNSMVLVQLDNNASQSIEELYKITYNLDGYIEDVWSVTPISRCVDYVKDNLVISFNQYTKSGFNISLNTEDTVIEEININGNVGIYYKDNHDYHHVMWDNGEYVFYISTNIGKDVLVKIAESVKK